MKPEEPAIVDLIKNQSYMEECAERKRVECWNRRKEPVFTRPDDTPRARGSSSAGMSSKAGRPSSADPVGSAIRKGMGENA